MKRITIFLLLSLLFASSGLQAQRKNDCRKFHLYADCNQFAGSKFKFDGQSRSNIIGVGDQLIYSVILNGDMQYKIYFCTSEYFRPIHIKLLNGESGELMFDNEGADYIDNVTLNIDKTQRIKIFVEILASNMSEEEKLEYFGCIGMTIKSKKVKK
jgi:hypothetical protein